MEILNVQSDVQLDLRCLLVDDDEDLRDAFAAWIERRGWSVTTADTVASAHTMIANQSFHLVLTDFSLPDGTGAAVVQAARARTEPRCPLIVVISGAQGVRMSQAASDEADAYLPKPFPFEEMDQLLQKARARATQ